MKTPYLLVLIGIFFISACGTPPTSGTSDRTQSTTSDTDDDARGRARIHTDLAVNYLEIASSSSAVEHNVVVGFKLGKEYYEKGIIAFSKGYDKYLPVSSGTKVKIFINREPQQLSGNFTRATNGNRRFINGYSELVQYYKQNFKVDDIVQVRILSNSEYQIFQ